ncbi:uncharacterized protein N7443_004484 [Penicillium atrosanguineum]|uniref:K Homology domain-containing protein n=1 Tax=Penicillium atrosanguineum TaxID=1132637 RepID=A0A9W9UA45_9EURO|nr:uncharacterized protein N7443_004484 [Penicillium atrosanguineum]KAJ5304824.1 hypothetical protein N7443_004484 [Penicillium atrosanguineum]KAJ5324289.1 hypothetical protein N7476_002889 [Penicillium atrosanguineum]
MADDDRRVKRSRFDQTEPELRRSRFDRRSRSPSGRQSEPTRTRSPLSREPRSPAGTGSGKDSPADPAAAAAAAAAKINAQLQAKKGIQHIDVPPIMSSASPGMPSDSPSNQNGSDKPNHEVYVADGDYIKDIEINDLRNRYTLTKGSTQKMIKDETGADVTTRGNYYPDKNMATAAKPPLYLHVTSTSKEGLDKAIQIIDDMMKKELPNLVDERRFRRPQREEVERDEYGRRKWPDERIPIDLEPIPGFNLRAQVVGQGGQYVKHIQSSTGCRVQIKGRNSGFIENSTGHESDEPMYLHVAGPDPAQVERAKELCEDLIKNVTIAYEEHRDNPPQRGYGNHGDRGGRGGGDRYQGGGGRGGYGGGYDRRDNRSRQSPGPSASPTSQAAPAAGNATDYAAQYAQYYGADPYAAYGGYENYVAYYNYYQQYAAAQQQQQQQSQSPAPPPPASEAPPPPPPGSGSPPPPPGTGPPGTGAGGYGMPPPSGPPPPGY